jgi:hypothetical protein
VLLGVVDRKVLVVVVALLLFGASVGEDEVEEVTLLLEVEGVLFGVLGTDLGAGVLGTALGVVALGTPLGDGTVATSSGWVFVVLSIEFFSSSSNYYLYFSNG